MAWDPKWGDEPERVKNQMSASAEHRNLHPGDLILRVHGFKIVRRLGEAEPVWALGSEEMTQADALAWCAKVEAAAKERRKKAEKSEQGKRT